MADARLTHGTRETLPFYVRQQAQDRTTAVANVTAELATERTPLVHTETREGEHTIRGRATGRYVAAQDGTTTDWRQALANYADRLESHVDEFQGFDGYTLADDNLSISKSGLLESVEWAIKPGQPYEFQYEATLLVGRPTLQAEAITRRNPTVDTSLGVPLRIDGVDCPGMRDLRVTREVGAEVNAIYNRSTAQNNDILLTDGDQTTLSYEGIHTGTASARTTADDALENLVATKTNVTAETAFPGYDLDGFVTAYESDQNQSYGGNSHHYRLEFTVGQRA